MKLPLGAALVLLLAPTTLVAQPRDTSIVSAGSEQAVRLGKVVLSRPFGAQLVDRLAVAGSFNVQGRRLHLIRGEAAGDCPARFVVIETAADRDPVISDPFGTCSLSATGRLSRGVLVVTMPATATGGPPVRFAYQGGSMRLLDPQPPSARVANSAAATGYAVPPASSCSSAAGHDAAAQTGAACPAGLGASGLND